MHLKKEKKIIGISFHTNRMVCSVISEPLESFDSLRITPVFAKATPGRQDERRKEFSHLYTMQAFKMYELPSCSPHVLTSLKLIADCINEFCSSIAITSPYVAVSIETDLIHEQIMSRESSENSHHITCRLPICDHPYQLYQATIKQEYLFAYQLLALLSPLNYLCIIPNNAAYLYLFKEQAYPLICENISQTHKMIDQALESLKLETLFDAPNTNYKKEYSQALGLFLMGKEIVCMQ